MSPATAAPENARRITREVLVRLESSSVSIAVQERHEFLKTVEDIQREVIPALRVRRICITRNQHDTGDDRQEVRVRSGTDRRDLALVESLSASSYRHAIHGVYETGASSRPHAGRLHL